jgi:N-acetylmuramoyl-L-alanine amidase
MSLWNEDFVIVNKYSRPATKLVGVRGIVMHWTATNGATDENEQSFFDGSDGGGSRYASAHFFVDRDSSTLIIPLDEVAYHANEKPCKIAKLQATSGGYIGGANLTAIGIEMCVEKDGTIHPDTIARAADIVAELCKRFNLNPLTDIYRHFDITGKNCPAPWVSNPQQFVDFKNSVNTLINKPIVKLTVPSQPSTNLYRVRKSWADVASQIGAFSMLDSAITLAKANAGYEVYDGKGNQVYPSPSKPATPPPVQKPVQKKKYLVLPATEDSWRVYPLNKAPKKGNECGMLNPKKFGGLTYEILGNPQTDIYLIQTQSFGKVQIYGASSTGAKIVLK